MFDFYFCIHAVGKVSENTEKAGTPFVLPGNGIKKGEGETLAF